jgi:hypothetical protein
LSSAKVHEQLQNSKFIPETLLQNLFTLDSPSASHDGVQEVVVLDRMNLYFRNEGHKLESPFPTTKALGAN